MGFFTILLIINELKVKNIITFFGLNLIAFAIVG